MSVSTAVIQNLLTAIQQRQSVEQAALDEANDPALDQGCLLQPVTNVNSRTLTSKIYSNHNYEAAILPSEKAVSERLCVCMRKRGLTAAEQ